MNSPAVRWSVVVPLFDKQDYIESTLRSALAQVNAQDFEVLVVDDGSRDQGPARVQALVDPRVRLIRQPNAGVAAARNRGIAEARGDWVVFLDADDLLHPQAISAYGQLRSAYPEACVLGGKDVRIDSAELDNYRMEPLPQPLPMREVFNLPETFLKHGLPFSSSSVAIKRDFLVSNGLGFPVGESMGEDLDLWLRSAELTSIACTTAGLVVYRVGLAHSLMGSYRDLVLLPVWQRLRQRAQTGSMRPGLRSASMRLAAEMEVTLARRLAKAGQRREAWVHLWAARDATAGHRWWATLAALASGSTSVIRRLR